MTVPLAAGTVAGPTAWAALAMGNPSTADDTFWELLARHGARWSLVTPGDVATNGGVVVAPTDEGAVAGVLASNNLRFSPLGATRDLGRRWSTGVLPAALVRAPDAVAAHPGGGVLALVATAGGTLVEGTGALGGWARVARLGQIASEAAPSGCRLSELTAVTVTPQGSVLVGGACRARSTGPVVALVDGKWRGVGPVVGLGHLERVLRLRATAAGTDALVATTVGGDPVVVAARRTADGRWTASFPLSVRDATVVGSTLDDAGRVLVVVRGSAGLVAHVVDVAGATRPWRALPALPAGTQVVVPWRHGAQALVVHGAHLAVLATSGATWSVVQRMTVPIAYGSTS
jgi:hypothetical protein